MGLTYIVLTKTIHYPKTKAEVIEFEVIFKRDSREQEPLYIVRFDNKNRIDWKLASFPFPDKKTIHADLKYIKKIIKDIPYNYKEEEVL